MDAPLNPYRPPTETTTPGQNNALRTVACRHIRTALAIFLVPGIHNYLCFDQQRLASPEISPSPEWRLLDGLAISILALSVWFAGLPLLEWLTRLLHYWLGPRTDQQAWLVALYERLASTAYFALAGAVLWLFWNIGFYYLQLPFYVISVPIGIAGHVLAAALYLPLIYRWYRLEHRPRQS